jgi:hypothetical protein
MMRSDDLRELAAKLDSDEQLVELRRLLADAGYDVPAVTSFAELCDALSFEGLRWLMTYMSQQGAGYVLSKYDTLTLLHSMMDKPVPPELLR